jgi:hypothetical protein
MYFAVVFIVSRVTKKRSNFISYVRIFKCKELQKLYFPTKRFVSVNKL